MSEAVFQLLYIKHSLSANEIQSVMGIINGTTNYILTQMSVGKKEFADALKEAQEKGFAEQDPSIFKGRCCVQAGDIITTSFPWQCFWIKSILKALKI